MKVKKKGTNVSQFIWKNTSVALSDGPKLRYLQKWQNISYNSFRIEFYTEKEELKQQREETI